jgi:glycine/D-amino acid oxidase-like deaminating enzyme
MNDEYDALIIGAGVIGAAIAFEMAKKGYRTLNVDKLPAAGYGSTSNTCAIIRTHYSTLDGTAIAYESLLHWADWPHYLGAPDERGYAEFVRSGMVIIKSEAQDFGTHLALHDQLGIEYEVWDVETLKEKLPFCELSAFYPPRRPEDEKFGRVSAPHVPGAIFMPNAGYINDPQLSTHNLQRAAEARGATFLFNEEVVEIRRADGHVQGVTLRSGRRIEVPIVVNAAGPHSSIVNRLAGVDGDMRVRSRPLRHEVHYLPRPEGYDVEKHGSFTSDDDIGGYSRPEVGEMLLVGSQDPACDPQEWIDDPDDFDRHVTEEQWRAQVYRMALRIPGLPIPTKPKGIADLYDVTPDWIPIYDRSSLGGFYMAVGTSGNQYKNAPMVGLLMAELIEACEAGQDHDRDPVTVRGRYTDQVFNVGFYSRNRELNPASSLSVLG